jgi:phosphoglycolate phosphatase
MKYKTVVFDLDGTLLDTLEDLCDSTNYALARFGYPERTIAEVRSFVGNGIGKLVERALPNDTTEAERNAVLAEFRSHYAKNCNNKTKAYPGICDMLNALKEQGVNIAVVSNKVDSAVKELCARYFPGIFEVAVGEREGVCRKPAPDSVFAAMEALGAEKGSTVYIGDSEVDIETAENADIDMIAVSWGFRDKAALELLGDITIASTAKELELLLFNQI